MSRRFFDKFHIPAFGQRKYLMVICIAILILACLAAGIFIGKAIYGKNEISFYGVIIQRIWDQTRETYSNGRYYSLKNSIDNIEGMLFAAYF